MSESQSNDHWKSLADEIGADVPDPPPEPVNEPAPEVVTDDQPSDEILEEPAPLVESAEEDVQPQAPAPAAKPVGPNHWWHVASELGIEVPEEPEPEPDPEPELEPVPEPEPESKASSEPEALPESMPEEDATDEVVFAGFRTGPAGESELPERQDRAEPPVAETFESPDDTSQMPLFADPGLVVETPGVLDAIFDAEEAVRAESERSVYKHADEPERTGDEAEELVVHSGAGPQPTKGELFGEVAQDDGEVNEPAEFGAEEPGEVDDDESVAAVSVPDEETAAEPDEEGKRPKRRRRRRRRRPKKDRAEPAGEAGKSDADSAVGEKESSDSQPRAESGKSEKRDEAEAAKDKHRKIPTWEEAIDVVISTNMESRNKASSGGSRGRGRGRK